MGCISPTRQNTTCKVEADNFLGRKKSNRQSKIVNDCPDIEKNNRKVVHERNIGADSWRWTGVLTFDDNVRLSEKVMYERISSDFIIASCGTMRSM